MELESWLKASAWLGFKEVNQSAASLLLELDGPSCEAVGEVLSMDVSPCGSGKEYYLFGCGDCLSSGMGEAVADGGSSTWGVLVNGVDWSEEGYCPNKIW